MNMPSRALLKKLRGNILDVANKHMQVFFCQCVDGSAEALQMSVVRPSKPIPMHCSRPVTIVTSRALNVKFLALSLQHITVAPTVVTPRISQAAAHRRLTVATRFDTQKEHFRSFDVE